MPSSYPLQVAGAHYSTGSSASQAIRRAVLAMEEQQAAGKHIVGGWLYETALDGEPFGFVFVAQD